MPAPSVLVTCGPAYEPIDAVRCITNHSTGELGAMLSEALAAAGFAVTCLRGEMATHPAPPGARVAPFGTNGSLIEILEGIEPPAAVFHAAALCDFTVVQDQDAAGKIRSDTPELRLVLKPAPKVLPLLRPLFPDALIVGWKYEVDGTRQEAIERGRHQIAKCNTSACVVNGPAYGPGLGLLENEEVHHHPTRMNLCEHLARWTRDRLTLP
jgi:phosphopantothenoylcysteine synthetase/decarboxylase